MTFRNFWQLQAKKIVIRDSIRNFMLNNGLKQVKILQIDTENSSVENALLSNFGSSNRNMTD